jgi:twitching motility protein PilT
MSDDHHEPAANGHQGITAVHTPSTDLVPVDVTDDVVDEFGGVDVRLGTYLHEVLQWGASDLHVTAGRPPMVRIDGTIRPRDTETILEPDVIRTMLRTTMADESWDVFESRRQVDYSLTLGTLGRFRVNAYHQLGAPAAAFRAISSRIPTLQEIGVRPEVERMASFPYGLVLFVGPTGSGKSTTQAALIGRLNAERPAHILTIEDPVEYMHAHGGLAMINQREVGTDVRSFADGLRAALREDPDIILLGEMRDEESIAITLTLAETGHLVFATLHTNDAAQAIDRIIDSYPAEREAQIKTQLAGALQGVVSQRLVPKIGGGRAAAFEVMLANDAVRNLIREGKTRQLRNVVATTSVEGMCTIESSLDALVQSGTVAYEDAIAVSQYPKEIHDPAMAAAIANAREAAFAGRR